MAHLLVMLVVPLQCPVRGGRDDKVDRVLFERRSDAGIGVNQLMSGLSSPHKRLNPLNRLSITRYARNAVIDLTSGKELGKQCLFIVDWL
jgi:hypothetical protein